MGCSCAIIRNVINGSCFSIERFSLYLSGKTKLTLYDNKQSNKVKLMKRLFLDNNKVLLQMQLNPLVKYQAVKKEGFNSEEAAETIHKEIEEATSLEMPMLQKNMTLFLL
jgi:biopolymer transport protein ExbB